MPKNPYKLKESLALIPKKETQAFPMSIVDWKRLKDLLEKAKTPFFLIKDIGSAFGGIFASALVAYISLPREASQTPRYVASIQVPDQLRQTLLWVCIISFVLGAVFYLIYFHKKNNLNISIDEVKKEMSRIESQYEQNLDDGSSTPL